MIFSAQPHDQMLFTSTKLPHLPVSRAQDYGCYLEHVICFPSISESCKSVKNCLHNNSTFLNDIFDHPLIVFITNHAYWTALARHTYKLATIHRTCCVLTPLAIQFDPVLITQCRPQCPTIKSVCTQHTSDDAAGLWRWWQWVFLWGGEVLLVSMFQRHIGKINKQNLLLASPNHRFITALLSIQFPLLPPKLFAVTAPICLSLSSVTTISIAIH